MPAMLYHFAMTKLAVPITAVTPAEAGQQALAAQTARAEMLELRLDYLKSLTVDAVTAVFAEIAAQCVDPLPVIATCRDKAEGGARDWPLALRLAALEAAAKCGADFIDVEYANYRLAVSQARIQKILQVHPRSRLILSAHDFSGKFNNIKDLYTEIASVGSAIIPKIVYTPGHITDCFDAFDLLHEHPGEDLIVLCMGQPGLISRILAPKLGGFVTFAGLTPETATAPGQLTVEQSRNSYRYARIDSQTALFGVIADPVAHSMSPAIHNACFAEADMNRLYLPLLVQGGQGGFDAFMDAVAARPWLGFRGFSVTIPHKSAALAYVKAKGGWVEPLAERIGAVNTIVVADDGRLSAYNTDYAAVLDAITGTLGIDRTGLAAVPVAVIGAGGVSRAIVAGLRDAGARVTIYNRTVEKAAALAGEFGCDYAGLDALPRLDARLIINGTSIGMVPNTAATPVPAECIRPGVVVFDTVYNPVQTLLLTQAAQAGATTIDGVTMFVNQALAQFRLFTGQGADPGLMRSVVLGLLAAK